MQKTETNQSVGKSSAVLAINVSALVHLPPIFRDRMHDFLFSSSSSPLFAYKVTLISVTKRSHFVRDSWPVVRRAAPSARGKLAAHRERARKKMQGPVAVLDATFVGLMFRGEKFYGRFARVRDLRAHGGFTIFYRMPFLPIPVCPRSSSLTKYK